MNFGFIFLLKRCIHLRIFDTFLYSSTKYLDFNFCIVVLLFTKHFKRRHACDFFRNLFSLCKKHSDGDFYLCEHSFFCPWLKNILSPITSSFDKIVLQTPSLFTFTLGVKLCLRVSMALDELLSW